MSEEKLTLKENLKQIFSGCLTIPNLLSVIRIALIPVFAVLYNNGHIWWAVAVIAVSGLSDMLDGKIARRFNQVSTLGKMLDPIADKLTVFAIAIVLFLKFKSAESPSMQNFAWVFLMFLVKDLLMLLGCVALVLIGTRPMPAEIYGKAATVVFYIVMFAIVGFGPEVGAVSSINASLTIPEPVMFVLVVIAVIMTFIAFFSYLPPTYRQVKELKKNKKS